MEAEIEDFLEGFNQPPYRACGSMGSGGNLVKPSTVVRGRPAAEWI
jgi:hypothetical protein